MTEAATLATEGRYQEARDAYQGVLRDHPREPAAADALYGLAILEVDPKSPLRNYQAARASFQRLLTDHAASAHASEARAWRAALGDLERCAAEAARLRENLERLKRLDLELEPGR